jgi:hypothetical protein
MYKPIIDSHTKIIAKQDEAIKKQDETIKAIKDSPKIPAIENSKEQFEIEDANEEIEDPFHKKISIIVKNATDNRKGKISLKDTFVFGHERNDQNLPKFLNSDNVSLQLIMNDNGDYFIEDESNNKYPATDSFLNLLFSRIIDNNVTPVEFANYLGIVNLRPETAKITKYKKELEKTTQPFASTSTPIIDEVDGDGGGFKKSKAVIVIPSNVKELNKRLKVLIAGYKEGHNNSYNEINEILKELLNRKEMNEHQYKTTLNLLHKKSQKQ